MRLPPAHPTPRASASQRRLRAPWHLPATVVSLGVVSFFTDLSSEMIYPLLPVWVSAVLGAGPAALGVIEGVAESTAALLKVISGRLSDRTRRRKPWVLAGYALAGAARPLIGLASSWPAVLGLRFVDRLGKGLRTSPRDALIAEVTPSERRGEAFGFQRALDHAGAVVGPLVAAALLLLPGVELREVFFLAAVPAAAAVIVILVAVREARGSAETAPTPRAVGRRLGAPLRWVVFAVVVFTLGNSTDAFLILRLANGGVPPAVVALLWSLLHVVKMTAAYVGGKMSDRLGRRPMMLAGWTWYAAVYLAFATASEPVALIAAFLAYGVYFGLTEPVEKAWVAELAPAGLKGTAFGAYHGAVGLAALPASALFGALWQLFGAPTAFFGGAGLAGVAAAMLFFIPQERNSGDDGAVAPWGEPPARPTRSEM